jgi:hypothetical protein
MSSAELARRFHSLNAKYTPVEEIAETFIPPEQWSTLIRNEHTLLVGPRGAGKTTLLKMLQPRALDAWEHGEARVARNVVRFTGVYITTDRSWSEQVSALGSGLSEKHGTALGLSAFTSHVLGAIAGAAADRLDGLGEFRRVDRKRLDAQTEAQLARQVSTQWLIDRPVATVRGLQHAMADRIGHIASFALREELRGSQGRDERLDKELPVLDYLSAAILFIDRFNAAAGEPDGLWGLLFDELELAPPSITHQLQQGLRGADRRLLFKLSLAPYTEGADTLRNALKAQQAHDFNIARLTYPHKNEGYEFCRALLASMVGVERDQLDEDEVLGTSPFDAAPEQRSSKDTAYRAGSPQLERLKEVAAADATFRRWMTQQGIDLGRSESLGGEERAAKLRKISAITLVRGTYRTTDEAFTRRPRRRRSRKSPTLYTGATALYAMAEGNPRWFMNLVRPLVEEYHREGARRRVPQRRQTRQVRDVMRLFRAVLTALPLSPMAAGKREFGVLPVIDAIGTKLSDELIEREFNADPPGKFRVDADVSKEIIEDLQFALNAGGIIYMPGTDDPDILSKLEGKTFRLAYMLAPGYPITLTTGRTLDLSTVLKEQAPSWELSRQLELGEDEEDEEDDENNAGESHG